MEFLMTYGWALLVVLAAVAALAYFGVLSPGKFLPEKCSLPAGLACLDSSLTNAAGATLVIQNSLGVDMTGVVVSLAGTDCTADSGAGVSLANGAKATFAIGCTPTTGAKYKGTLSVLYTNADTNLTHTLSGEFIKQVAAS